MIGQIPSFDDYVRSEGRVVGSCIDCGYRGAMDHGMTGYECTRCKGMNLQLDLKDGRQFRQFANQLVGTAAPSKIR